MGGRGGVTGRAGRAAAMLCAAVPAVCAPGTAAAPGFDRGLAGVCLHDGIEPSQTARLIDEALAVLQQSGHDPSAYRLELRMEDARSPDGPTIHADRVQSVVFLPARRGELYRSPAWATCG